MTKDQLTLAISKAQKAFYDREFRMPTRVQIDRSWERVLFSGLQSRKINGVSIHAFDMSRENMIMQADGVTLIMAFSDFMPTQPILDTVT